MDARYPDQCASSSGSEQEEALEKIVERLQMLRDSNVSVHVMLKKLRGVHSEARDVIVQATPVPATRGWHKSVTIDFRNEFVRALQGLFLFNSKLEADPDDRRKISAKCADWELGKYTTSISKSDYESILVEKLTDIQRKIGWTQPQEQTEFKKTFQEQSHMQENCESGPRINNELTLLAKSNSCSMQQPQTQQQLLLSTEKNCGPGQQLLEDDNELHAQHNASKSTQKQKEQNQAHLNEELVQKKSDECKKLQSKSKKHKIQKSEPQCSHNDNITQMPGFIQKLDKQVPQSQNKSNPITGRDKARSNDDKQEQALNLQDNKSQVKNKTQKVNKFLQELFGDQSQPKTQIQKGPTPQLQSQTHEVNGCEEEEKKSDDGKDLQALAQNLDAINGQPKKQSQPVSGSGQEEFDNGKQLQTKTRMQKVRTPQSQITSNPVIGCEQTQSNDDNQFQKQALNPKVNKSETKNKTQNVNKFLQEQPKTQIQKGPTPQTQSQTQEVHGLEEKKSDDGKILQNLDAKKGQPTNQSQPVNGGGQEVVDNGKQLQTKTQIQKAPTSPPQITSNPVTGRDQAQCNDDKQLQEQELNLKANKSQTKNKTKKVSERLQELFDNGNQLQPNTRIQKVRTPQTQSQTQEVNGHEERKSDDGKVSQPLAQNLDAKKGQPTNQTQPVSGSGQEMVDNGKQLQTKMQIQKVPTPQPQITGNPVTGRDQGQCNDDKQLQEQALNPKANKSQTKNKTKKVSERLQELFDNGHQLQPKIQIQEGSTSKTQSQIQEVSVREEMKSDDGNVLQPLVKNLDAKKIQPVNQTQPVSGSGQEVVDNVKQLQTKTQIQKVPTPQPQITGKPVAGRDQAQCNDHKQLQEPALNPKVNKSQTKNKTQKVSERLQELFDNENQLQPKIQIQQGPKPQTHSQIQEVSGPEEKKSDDGKVLQPLAQNLDAKGQPKNQTQRVNGNGQEVVDNGKQLQTKTEIQIVPTPQPQITGRDQAQFNDDEQLQEQALTTKVNESQTRDETQKVNEREEEMFDNGNHLQTKTQIPICPTPQLQNQTQEVIRSEEKKSDDDELLQPQAQEPKCSTSQLQSQTQKINEQKEQVEKLKSLISKIAPIGHEPKQSQILQQILPVQKLLELSEKQLPKGPLQAKVTLQLEALLEQQQSHRNPTLPKRIELDQKQFHVVRVQPLSQTSQKPSTSKHQESLNKHSNDRSQPSHSRQQQVKPKKTPKQQNRGQQKKGRGDPKPFNANKQLARILSKYRDLPLHAHNKLFFKLSFYVLQEKSWQSSVSLEFREQYVFSLLYVILPIENPNLLVTDMADLLLKCLKWEFDMFTKKNNLSQYETILTKRLVDQEEQIRLRLEAKQLQTDERGKKQPFDIYTKPLTPKLVEVVNEFSKSCEDERAKHVQAKITAITKHWHMFIKSEFRDQLTLIYVNVVVSLFRKQNSESFETTVTRCAERECKIYFEAETRCEYEERMTDEILEVRNHMNTCEDDSMSQQQVQNILLNGNASLPRSVNQKQLKVQTPVVQNKHRDAMDDRQNKIDPKTTIAMLMDRAHDNITCPVVYVKAITVQKPQNWIPKCSPHTLIRNNAVEILQFNFCRLLSQNGDEYMRTVIAGASTDIELHIYCKSKSKSEYESSIVAKISKMYELVGNAFKNRDGLKLSGPEIRSKDIPTTKQVLTWVVNEFARERLKSQRQSVGGVSASNAVSNIEVLEVKTLLPEHRKPWHTSTFSVTNSFRWKQMLKLMNSIFHKYDPYPTEHTHKLTLKNAINREYTLYIRANSRSQYSYLVACQIFQTHNSIHDAWQKIDEVEMSLKMLRQAGVSPTLEQLQEDRIPATIEFLENIVQDPITIQVEKLVKAFLIYPTRPALLSTLEKFAKKCVNIMNSISKSTEDYERLFAKKVLEYHRSLPEPTHVEDTPILPQNLCPAYRHSLEWVVNETVCIDVMHMSKDWYFEEMNRNLHVRWLLEATFANRSLNENLQHLLCLQEVILEAQKFECDAYLLADTRAQYDRIVAVKIYEIYKGVIQVDDYYVKKQLGELDKGNFCFGVNSPSFRINGVKSKRLNVRPVKRQSLNSIITLLTKESERKYQWKINLAQFRPGQPISPAPLISANSFRSQEVVEQIILSLVHANQCRNDRCRKPGCDNMKDVMNHAAECDRAVKANCYFCRSLVTLSYHHARQCQQLVCSIPFCLTVKNKIKEHRLMKGISEALSLGDKRKIADLLEAKDTSLVASSSSNTPENMMIYEVEIVELMNYLFTLVTGFMNISTTNS